MPMAPAADSTEPLMGAVDDPEHLQDGDLVSDDYDELASGEISRLEEGTEETASLTSFVWILTLAAGVSGLLFGYDTGVISSTLVSIHAALSHRLLTTLDKSLITSAVSFFALVASPCTGFLADAVGRKPVILLASLLFIAGALWQALAATVPSMIIGRSIVGLAVGSASFVVPLYISELSPSRWRGRLVTITILFITGGQVVAYIIGWLFSQSDNGWRWMVGLGIVPAVVQLAMLLGMPETPRYLVKAGRADQAEKVLRKMYGAQKGKDRVVAGILRAIRKEIHEEETVINGKSGVTAARPPIVDLFSNAGTLRALVIACLLQSSQQLCGFNSLMYFSATIFSLVGFTSPTLASLTIAVTNFLFTVVAFFAIDRIGRRRILLSSIPFMIVGLVLCALAFTYLDVHVTPSSNTKELYSSETSRAWAPPLLLVSLIIYVGTYALGLGNVPWQQSELFPLRVRSIGSSLSTATNWLSNTIVGLTFLPMLEALSPQVTFVCYAGVCCGAWAGVWWCYPETAGLRLEEVGVLLEKGWGVVESVESWERRKRIRHGEQVVVQDHEESSDAGG